MKKIYFYLLILTLLFLLFPLPTFAQWSLLRDALLFLPTLTIVVVLGFVIFLSGGITWLTGAILNWVISPGFVSLSYTQPCGGISPSLNCNPIIEIGLNITQSFVNLALVVILVVIALSIALRLGEYGSKKIFAKLIIIALLVNFAPVLVGLIVDASNIVMHYFLDAITEGATGIGSQVSAFSTGLSKVLFGIGGDIMSRLGLVMQGIVQIVVNLAMAFAFLLFAAIFLFRYIVIWTLVILSPLAFVSWILPATKKFWDMWWNQLIQWSIIGIPIAFFLYLSLNSFSYLRSAFVSNLEMPGMEPATVGFLNEIFPFFVIVVFLILGFGIGLQTGAMGASGVISLVKKGARSTGAWARKTTAKRVTGPMAGTTAKAIASLAKKTEKVPFLKYATRGLEMATVSPLIEYAAKQRKIKKPENWDGLSIPEKKMFITGKGMSQDQLVLASEMAEEGTFQKSGPAFQEKMLEVAKKFSKDPRYLKETGDIVDALPNKITKEMKIDLELAPIDPKAIDKATKRLKRDVEREKLELKIQGIIKEFKLKDDEEGKAEDKAAGVLHARGLKPKNISKVSKDSLKSEPFQLAMREMKSSNLQALRNSFDAETIKAVLDEEKGLNTITEKEFKVIEKDNPDLVRWAYRTPTGRETLNWADRWGKEEELPTPAPTPTPTTAQKEEGEKKEKGEGPSGQGGVKGSEAGKGKTPHGRGGIGT